MASLSDLLKRVSPESDMGKPILLLDIDGKSLGNFLIESTSTSIYIHENKEYPKMTLRDFLQNICLAKDWNKVLEYKDAQGGVSNVKVTRTKSVIQIQLERNEIFSDDKC